MASVHAKQALLPVGWRKDVRLEIAGAYISSVTADATASKGDVRVNCLLPALANLHSHSFQRAMAGMTERRGDTPDSFWTWRDLMYRFINVLTPEDIESIAAQAFMEMQEQGFSAVAEFHYVHHQMGGSAYADPAELSQRIFAAAQRTGIGLTHLPVLYSRGGLNNEQLHGGQLRFGNSVEQYLDLHRRAADALRQYLPLDCNIGIAPHSLRAVSDMQLSELTREFPTGPIHIHVAEQQREVEDMIKVTRTRPVRHLLEHFAIDERWCLIHATHMDESETTGVAQSGAVAGLCPITEANLGDGTFNAMAFKSAAGCFGIGTDSNICITAAGELAQLEYSQRLKHQERNVLADRNGSSGQALWLNAAAGGARALQRHCGEISVGKLADLVAIDDNAIALCSLEPDQLIDGLVFASREKCVLNLWSAGRICVNNGQHVAYQGISQSYRKTIKRLRSLI